MNKPTKIWIKNYFLLCFYLFILGGSDPACMAGQTQPPRSGHWPKPVTRLSHARSLQKQMNYNSLATVASEL